MNRKALFLIAVAAVALLMGGCVAPIGMFNGFSKNPMSKIFVVKYPGTKMPYVTAHEYAVIRRMAESCQAQIAPQMSSPTEAAVSGALPYGTTGFFGVGIASLFFPWAIPMEYAGYGGTAGAFSGGTYGKVVWSYANVSGVALCASDFVKRAGIGNNIFILPAYVRAKHEQPTQRHSPQRRSIAPAKSYQKASGKSEKSNSQEASSQAITILPPPPPL